MSLSFRASSEFAADKAAGVPCPHLLDDRSCGIHADLRDSGYRGCAAFDCFGAGQHVTQITFAGERWQDDPARAATAFAVFEVMRRLKELLWHLADASIVVTDEPLGDQLCQLRTRIQAWTGKGADELEGLDVRALQSQAMRLLQRVSKQRRAGVEDPSGLELAAADLSGADLAGANLRGADLRYARLSNAALVGADLFGADLKDADVRGARLAASLYLTPMQLEVANGDEATTIPSALRRPDHWVGRSVVPRPAPGHPGPPG